MLKQVLTKQYKLSQVKQINVNTDKILKQQTFSIRNAKETSWILDSKTKRPQQFSDHQKLKSKGGPASLQKTESPKLVV